MSNQGVIAGADVSITAGNLLNQGRISGTGSVALEARNDLLNQGQIQGRDVALVAGNNLVSEAAKAINGVGILSGINASNTLQLMAGNDMALTGTRVQAGGSAALIAGNNLSLTPSALRDDNGLLRGGDAVSVTTGKDLIVSAGNDLQLHGVTIAAGGSAALQAGNNLSLTPTIGLDGKVATRTSISTGDSLQLTAGNDLTIRQAEVKAGGDLIAAAGNNLNVESVLNDSETNRYNSRNGKTRVTTTTTTQSIDQQALAAGGNLILSAGNDVNLVAAKLDAGKGLGISAGNDINASTLTTVDTSDVLETRKRFKQTTSTRDETVHGTEFSAGGNVAMQAGNDITLTAASAATKEGGITLAAGNDVNLLAASEQHDAVQDMTKKKKGTFSSKTTTTHDAWHDNVAVTTTLSADTVQIAAGNDLLSQGAQVASTGDVVLAAGNNITLDTVQNTHSEEHEKTVKKSGLYGGGGFSAALGVTKKTDGLDVTEVSNSGSLVGSTDGAVTITAGNKVSITGSDVLSATSTTIVGKEVTIAAAENTVDTVQTSKQQSAGITLGLTGGAVDAAQAIYGAVKRGSEVEDDRLKALYAAKAGYAVSDTVGMVNNGLKGYDGQAVAGNTTKAGTAAADGAQGAANAAGVSLRLGIGASSSSSKTTTHEETTGGSRILSNGDVTIAATGGDLNVVGSKIAGENVALAAANNLNLLSNKETNTTKSENKNAGGEIGISVGAVTGYYLSVSAGKGSAKGNSDLRTESVVTANDTLTLVSGNDTTIQGAQAIGNKVLANVGGDLLIKSEQDTNEYKSKQQQASLTLATGSGSGGSYSQQNVNSSYTSVTEQSGIQAGNGGFDIVVGGDTKLVGGAIVSSASSSLNTLSTDSLTAEDLKNKAEYEANSLGVSVSGSGFKPTLGLPQSDKDSSVTHSAIAAGSMEVRNGNSSALDGIKRDTDELANSGLKKIFDEQKVSERMEIGSVATDLVRNYQAQQIRKKQEAIDDVQKRADQALADGNLQLSSDLRAEVVSLREDRDGGKVGKTLTYAGVGFGLSLLTGSSSLGDTLSYAKDLFLYNGAELNADTAIRQGHETQAIAFTCGVGKTPDQCAGLKPPAGKGVDGLLAWGKENDVVINFLNEIPEGANIIATNGILNNPQRAGQLAMGHDRRSKVDDTVYVQYYGTGGLATDLFAAGWEKFAVPFGLNSSETTRSLADAILRQGDNADLELLAHSRGTIVMANALAAVADSGYKNDNSGFNSINVGSAVRAGRLANPIKSVIGDGRISDHMVYLNNPDDFMPSILGVSFIGGTKYADPSDADYYVHKVRSNFWKSVFGVGSLGGDDTAHNGYINNNIKSPNNWNEKKVDEYNKMVGGK